jgi:hypothetical protein
MHTTIAKSPSWLAISYINFMSIISRNCLPETLSVRVHNSILGHAHTWPEISFSPRWVVVGSSTPILLIQHIGEFDEAALFSKSLDYEKPVFEWLERRVVAEYDLVIEIAQTSVCIRSFSIH